MKTSVDEWFRDYLPQVSVTAFFTIITGEITELLTVNELKYHKSNNLKSNEEEVKHLVDSQNDYYNYKQFITRIEQENEQDK